jgi:N-methylhydantoinase A
VLSAFGIDRGDIKFNFARSLFVSSKHFDYAAVNDLLRELESEGVAYLDRMNVPQERRVLQFSAEARYAGQVWQLTLPLPHPRIGAENLPDMVEAFHRLHEQHYSVRAVNDPVEITEWNLIAIGCALAPETPPAAAGGSAGRIAQTQKRRSAFLKEAGGAVDLPIFDLESLRPGDIVAGPALIQDKLTVTLVPVEATAALTAHQSIFIDLRPS